MTRYLLDQLPAAERDLYEQQWFVDKAQYAQLCEIENSLIDDYVRGHLAADERALFEQKFLTIPARRERVQTARALLHEIDQQAIQPAPISRWKEWLTGWRAPQLIPVLSLIVLLIIGSVWLARKRANEATANKQEQSPTPMQTTEPERTQPKEEIAQVQTTPKPQLPSPTTAKPATLLFTLSGTILRSDANESLPTLKLAKNVPRVQLQVLLPTSDYESFAATLRTADGRDIARWSSIKAVVSNSGTASFLLPVMASTLKTGDYVLVVNGVKAQRETEELRRLPFRVIS